MTANGLHKNVKGSHHDSSSFGDCKMVNDGGWDSGDFPPKSRSLLSLNKIEKQDDKHYNKKDPCRYDCTCNENTSICALTDIAIIINGYFGECTNNVLLINKYTNEFIKTVATEQQWNYQEIKMMCHYCELVTMLDFSNLSFSSYYKKKFGYEINKTQPCVLDMLNPEVVLQSMDVLKLQRRPVTVNAQHHKYKYAEKNTPFYDVIEFTIDMPNGVVKSIRCYLRDFIKLMFRTFIKFDYKLPRNSIKYFVDLGFPLLYDEREHIADCKNCGLLCTLQIRKLGDVNSKKAKLYYCDCSKKECVCKRCELCHMPSGVHCDCCFNCYNIKSNCLCSSCSYCGAIDCEGSCDYCYYCKEYDCDGRCEDADMIYKNNRRFADNDNM
jgi:hypothetical protein